MGDMPCSTLPGIYIVIRVVWINMISLCPVQKSSTRMGGVPVSSLCTPNAVSTAAVVSTINPPGSADHYADAAVLVPSKALYVQE